jgi:two-component system nitrogen regulation sensor histidine kinase GlnL
MNQMSTPKQAGQGSATTVAADGALRPAELAGLDLLASAVIMLDSAGRINYANAAAENLLENSVKALSRQKLTALFLNPEEINAICQHALTHKFADMRQDLTLERAGREPLHVHSIVSALDDPKHPLLIELRENVQQLKLDREERMLDQSQVNKELIRNLAHEIKNPLGGIRGAAQLLEMELPALHLLQLREYTHRSSSRKRTGCKPWSTACWRRTAGRTSSATSTSTKCASACAA